MKAKKERAAGVLGYLDELVERLRDLVPAAIRQSDQDAIHQARVTTRRLKAALDLFSPAIDERRGRRLARSLRELRRSLGPLRDMDVMAGHLGELAQSSRWQEPAGWALRQLMHRRQVRLEKTQRRVNAHEVLSRLGEWWGVREHLRELGLDSIESRLRESLSSQLNQFARAADLAGAPQVETAAKQDPHELRIAGKALRYTLELAAAEGHPLPPHVLKTFKRMQDALGLWHDYVVLAQSILELSIEQQVALHDAPMMRRLLALSQESIRRSEVWIGRFHAPWRASGAGIRQAVESMFAPPLSESQTGPDPAGSGSPPGPEQPPQDAVPAA